MVLQRHEQLARRLDEVEEHVGENDDAESVTSVDSRISHLSHVTETPQVNADVSVQSEHLRSTVEPPLLTQTGRARSDTERSVADRSFSEVVSVSEKRRVKRCKGMI